MTSAIYMARSGNRAIETIKDAIECAQAAEPASNLVIPGVMPWPKDDLEQVLDLIEEARGHLDRMADLAAKAMKE